MNSIQIEDYQNISKAEFIPWGEMHDKTVLITGGTGLIGSNLVNALIYMNQTKGLNIKIVLPTRNVDNARSMFGDAVDLLVNKLGDELVVVDDVDYIVHLASPTSSKYFSLNPADTLLANIEGTKAVLELARQKDIKKFIYLSTMEVYGLPEKGHKVKESELGSFETMNARNSYPIAKIASEALCNAYWAQYGVPTVVMRATQTFGPGVKYDDGRVFAQFMRCAVEKKDIVLRSVGLTERSYLYTVDAVSAILVAMLRGMPGQAYTVANPDTYCSIKDMAKMVADEIAGGEINIIFDISDNIEKLGYASTLYMNLDVEKIKALGWKPTLSLVCMFKRMIAGL